MILTAANQDKLSPKEQELLLRLQELFELASGVSERLLVAERQNALKDDELATLRRTMVELQQENQHLREVLQTWRERLGSVLNQLKDIN
ncbi:MAG: hypothetical protein IJ228_09430 [Succinivibrio sp.]|nr:hypothetical protein [Succinivibrio sp.]